MPHCSTAHWRNYSRTSSLQVRRLLVLLRAMQLERQVAALHAALDAARQRGSLPTGSVLLAYG